MADQRTVTFFMAFLLFGTLSSGLPIPQDSPLDISPTQVDATQVQLPNGVLMPEALQQPQKDETPTNAGMTSDSQLVTAPQQGPLLEETPSVVTPSESTPAVETPMVAAPLGGTPLASPAVPEPEVQQAAAAEFSRPDCPEMEVKHIILCEVDDTKGDQFQLIPEAKATQSPAEIASTTQ